MLFSHESLSFTHQVQELAIVDVDLEAETVGGTAVFDPEQYMLHTWIHGMDGSYMQLSTEGENWLADFGSRGIDLQKGMGGRVELVDQASNATAVEWWIPKPSVTIYPDAQWFDGWGWSDERMVTLTVEGKEDCTVTLQPDGGEFFGKFAEGCFVVADDVVAFADGANTVEHRVRNLAIMKVDKDTGIVTGTADAGEIVNVWVWDLDGSNLEVTSVDGEW